MQTETTTYEQRLHRHYATRRARLIRPRNAKADVIAGRPADDLPRPKFDTIKKGVKASKQMILTASQIQAMQEMKAGGASYRDIANVVGCSHTTARRYARIEE